MVIREDEPGPPEVGATFKPATLLCNRLAVFVSVPESKSSDSISLTEYPSDFDSLSRPRAVTTTSSSAETLGLRLTSSDVSPSRATFFAAYPIKVNRRVASAPDTFNENSPSALVVVPRWVPTSRMFTPGRGAWLSADSTVPEMVISWAIADLFINKIDKSKPNTRKPFRKLPFRKYKPFRI